jgi:hypothetical protein
MQPIGKNKKARLIPLGIILHNIFIRIFYSIFHSIFFVNLAIKRISWDLCNSSVIVSLVFCVRRWRGIDRLGCSGAIVFYRRPQVPDLRCYALN